MGADWNGQQAVSVGKVVDLLGKELIRVLGEISEGRRGNVYLAGGTVRDLLLGRKPVDIDLTVTAQARKWAAELARRQKATLVPLGREEDAARVVWQGRYFDFSSFREGAQSIEEELGKRDITVNSMAIALDGLLSGDAACADRLEVIDPAGGLNDLARKRIRITSEKAFLSDPLRLLRVFRFAAALGFTVEKGTFALAARQHALIKRPAVERVATELELIIGSATPGTAFADLAETGLLFRIIPELQAGLGMTQPASHHLDVFDHSLAALQRMVHLQEEPARFFPDHGEIMTEYIAGCRHQVLLRWAALLHDLGKPVTRVVNEEREGRITFYNHDRVGAKIVKAIGRRLKWSTRDINTVAALVEFHMRPFHLCNVMRKGELSLRACLRLLRQTGPFLPGLFLLSMADTLAGRGFERPETIEQEIAALFARLEAVRREYVEPAAKGPPLLTGRDLKEELQLEPGPIFGTILRRVQEAYEEKRVTTREAALEMARRLLEDR